MRHMGMLAIAGATMVLAGCYDDSRPRPPGPPVAGRCEVGRVQYLIGTQMNDRLAERARARARARSVRVLTPGMAATMDYRPDRLNISVGGNGRVERVTCG